MRSIHGSILVISFCAVIAGCGEVTPATDGGVGVADAGADAIDPAPDAMVDPCAEVTCECEIDSDCGAHEVCDTSGPGRVCACAAGYELNAGGCEWGVAPVDPGFEDDAAWQVSGGAAVQPSAAGQMEPGQAYFNPAAACSLGQVWQEFEMPTYEQAEPFVASLTYRSPEGDEFANVSAALELGGMWKNLPRNPDWTSARVCLGEGAYGGAIRFGVSTTDKSFECNGTPTSTVAADHLAIVPADPGECPAPGEVRGGDLEDASLWTANAGGSGATAGVVAGVGEGGTSGGRMTTSTLCSSARMTTRASWPARSITHPALQVWWSGTAGKVLSLELDGRAVTDLVGNGAPQTTRICIPPWAQGGVTEMTWRLPSTAGTCANPDVRDFRFDNLMVVDEPACATESIPGRWRFRIADRRQPGQRLGRSLQSGAEPGKREHRHPERPRW